MKNNLKLFYAAVVIAVTQLTGCGGTIETNNIGLRTDFNGQIDEQLVSPGLYTSMFSHVREVTLKEVQVDLLNMTPKAKDNLSLKDLDVTIYYKVVGKDVVRNLYIKRTNSFAKVDHESYYLPGYSLVDSVARSEVASVISHHDSLTIHTQRDELAAEIKLAMQANLETTDPQAFVITKVIIRQVTTDAAVEESIRRVVTKGKELEAANLQVAIAEANAEATAKTANTLTPGYLQHEYNQALLKFAENKNATVILDSSNGQKIINLKKD